jgi:hypothetical protein
MNRLSISAAVAAACLLAACGPEAPADPYANPKLESPPAKITSERNKGAFAEGAALSMGPELKPLDPSPV